MPRFRPMGLGDIFDEAFDLYRKNFLFLLLVAAVVTVPMQIIAPVLKLIFPTAPTLAHVLIGSWGTFLPQGELTQMGPLFNEPLGLAFLFPLASAIMVVALATACAACYVGEGKTLKESYRVPLRRMGSLFITLIFYSLLMLAGFVCCYVGAIYPLTVLVFIAHTFGVEGQGPRMALRRSRELAAQYGGMIFGALVILWLISAVVGVGIRLPLIYAFDLIFHITPGSDLLFAGMRAGAADTMQQQVVAQVSEALSGLILTPFVFCVLTVLYFDLRIRKEAFDVVLLAQGLDYPPLAALTGYLPPASPMLVAPAAAARKRA